VADLGCGFFCFAIGESAMIGRTSHLFSHRFVVKSKGFPSRSIQYWDERGRALDSPQSDEANA
jgi:hypothetical protein